MIRFFAMTALSLFVGAAPQALKPVSQPPAPYDIVLSAARDANAPSGIPVRKLFDDVVRDPNITQGPDGMFYMVATTNPALGYTHLFPDLQRQDAAMWRITDGIRMWRSADLVHWSALGLVWSLDKDATWAHWYSGANPGVTVWAPEIHYLKGTWWIPYCATPEGHLNDLLPKGLGLLKSISGNPEGPYRDVKTDAPLGLGLDATLFQDDDGVVYYLYAGYNIARMKDDMSGFAEIPREVDVQPKKEWGEGVFLLKVGDKYILTNSGISVSLAGEQAVTTYDSYAVTSSKSIYGPYTGRYRALPHAGHNNYFKDQTGQWWSSYFGSGDYYAPWIGRPGIIPVDITRSGKISAKRTAALADWHYTFESPAHDWSAKLFDDQAWQVGPAGFGERAIMNAGPVSHVNTDWTSGDIWLRRKFYLKTPLPHSAALYLRYSGDIEVFLNGKLAAKLTGRAADYIVQSIDTSLLDSGPNTLAVHEASPTPLPTPVYANPEEKVRFYREEFSAHRYLDVGLVEKRQP